MNCQQVARFLDGEEVDQKADEVRGALQSHLPACPACARDWSIHQQLGAAPIAPMPAGMQARCRERVAALKSARRQRGSRRLLVVGMLAALTAAAAVLAIRLYETPLVRQRASLPAEAAAVAEERISPEPAAIRSGSAEMSAGADTQSAVRASAPASPRFSVRVMPGQQSADDAPSRSAIQAFEASLLDQLRAIPGLTLVDARQGGDREAPVDYELTIRGAGSLRDNRWSANVLVKPTQRTNGAITPVAANNISVLTPACTGAATETPHTSCSDPQRMAEFQLYLLRKSIFPPDPALRGQMQARLLDRSLSPGQRWGALMDLQQERPGVVIGEGGVRRVVRVRPGMDAATVRGAIELASIITPSSMRAQIWSMLRGSPHAELIPPLIQSVRIDSDEAVRLEALTTLCADYAENAEVRAFLRTVARDDQQELMRRIAQRRLEGEAGWIQYAADTLRSQELPDAERVAPLLHMAQNGEYAQLRVQLDAPAIRALSDVIPRLLAAAPAESQLPASPPNALITVISGLPPTGQPELANLYLNTLQATRDPRIRRMAIEALAARHGSDPRVSAVLEDLAVNEPDAQLRELAAGTKR